MKRRIATIMIAIIMILSCIVPSLSNIVYAEDLSENVSKIGVNHPSEPGEVMLFKEAKPIDGKVNTWEITLRVEAKDKPVTSDIVLVVDTSGSMKESGRIQSAKEAAKKFIDKLLLSDTTKIGIVSFAENVEEKSGLTTDKDKLISSVDALYANGGTFTQGGLKKAQEMLSSSNADNKHIVLLSDGEPTYSYKINNPESYLSKQYIGDYSYGVKGYIRTFNSYGYATNLDIPEEQYDYNKTVGEGTAMFHQYNNRYYIGKHFYNHGNSAINQANFAKKANTTVWSIALEAGTTGENVLQKIANDGKYYKSNSEELNIIFKDIAGSINSAVKDAKVKDIMGAGFEITEDGVKKSKRLKVKSHTKMVNFNGILVHYRNL